MNGPLQWLAGDHVPLRSLESVKNGPTELNGISCPHGKLICEINLQGWVRRSWKTLFLSLIPACCSSQGQLISLNPFMGRFQVLSTLFNHTALVFGVACILCIGWTVKARIVCNYTLVNVIGTLMWLQPQCTCGFMTLRCNILRGERLLGCRQSQRCHRVTMQAYANMFICGSKNRK